jgi:predicted regulator of Ras-like GTPase activity (Roadblock/LC7/MglB family)
MEEGDSGQWDALFESDEVARFARPGSPGSASTSLQELREVPGVRGVVQVALDGVLQAHALDGSPEQAASMTAYLGAAARQVGALMAFNQFDHAMLNYLKGGNPVVVVRRGSSFLGFLLDGDIAASHILTRIRERIGA